MKTTFTYDHYADYAELTARLVYFSEHYPNYTRLTSLGKTPEGRNLWAMEVTDLRCGDFDEKPAQHIDGEYACRGSDRLHGGAASAGRAFNRL